jgi:hypothetical protein
MTADERALGLAEARRRFGSQLDRPGTNDGAHEWTVEELRVSNAAVGAAHAAARFGDRSAQRALDDLMRDTNTDHNPTGDTS